MFYSIQRLGPLVLSLAVLAGACANLEQADDLSVIVETNHCTTATDCDSGATCENGICVATTSGSAQGVILQITPGSTPSGGTSLPTYMEVDASQAASSAPLGLPRR